MLQVICNNRNFNRKLKVDPEYHQIIKALATCKEDHIIKNIMDKPSLQAAIERNTLARIGKEIDIYCKKDTKSVLRTKGVEGNDLKAFSFTQFEQELEDVTPLFWKIIKAATFNSNRINNKKKTSESVKPAMLASAAKLIAIHTEDMCVFKYINGLILRKAGAKKMAFVQLSRTYDTVSYDSIQKLLDVYADNYEETIKKWIGEIESKDPSHPGFTLANDNVDWEIGTRHMSSQNQNKSVHKVNVVAYKHRVNAAGLPDDGPQKDIKEISLQDMLPSADDTQLLTAHLVILIGNLWAENIPSLSWFTEHIPSHIQHDFEKEMRSKMRLSSQKKSVLLLNLSKCSDLSVKRWYPA